MDTEHMTWAVRQMTQAADRASAAADRMEAAAHRIAVLLEDGYGGNGLRLLEALEKTQSEPGPSCIQQEIEIVEKRCDDLINFLRTNSQYWREHRPTVEFYESQIQRLKTYLTA